MAKNGQKWPDISQTSRVHSNTVSRFKEEKTQTTIHHQGIYIMMCNTNSSFVVVQYNISLLVSNCCWCSYLNLLAFFFVYSKALTSLSWQKVCIVAPFFSSFFYGTNQHQSISQYKLICPFFFFSFCLPIAAAFF